MVSIWLVFLSRRSLPKQARALADGPRIHPKRSNSALAAVAYDIPIFLYGKWRPTPPASASETVCSDPAWRENDLCRKNMTSKASRMERSSASNTTPLFLCKKYGLRGLQGHGGCSLPVGAERGSALFYNCRKRTLWPDFKCCIGQLLRLSLKHPITVKPNNLIYGFVSIFVWFRIFRIIKITRKDVRIYKWTHNKTIFGHHSYSMSFPLKQIF